MQEMQEVPTNGVIFRFDMNTLAVMAVVIPVAQHRPKGRDQLVSDITRTCGIVVILFGKRAAQHRSAGTQDIHRMCRFDGANDVDDCRRQCPRSFQFGIEGRELLLVRQSTMKKQPRSLLEARMFGEIVDGLAAVAQVPRLAVDERARRAIEVDAFQAAVNLDCFGCFGH